MNSKSKTHLQHNTSALSRISGLTLSRIIRLSLITSLTAIACLTLTACPFPPRIHRMDVQQGNALKEEQICQLKRGMSKQEVQEILGSPMLTHVLDEDRWDYYYSLKPGKGGPKVEKHFSVFFKQDRLARYQ